MSDIILDLRPVIDQDGVNHVKSVLNSLADEDHLTITIESADSHQAGRLFAVLDEGHWDYQPKGGEDGMYYILVTGKHGSKNPK